MTRETSQNRRGFLKGLTAIFGGFGALGLLTKTAQAGRSRYRGYYGGPYYAPRPYYSHNSHRRIYGAPGYYGGGYRPPVYNQGYYGAPYVVPAPVVPVVPVQPYYYNNFYGPPLGSRTAPRALDVLRLLEA